MLVSEYDIFVRDSDRSVGLDPKRRLDIATYGLAAEVGSVVAAVKKRLLAEGGEEEWNVPNDEIREELGDVVWYCFALARAANPDKAVNIFLHDIANLKSEVGGEGQRAKRLEGVLDPSKREKFLKAAEGFPKLTRNMSFDDYQDTAFLTARAKGKTLVEVCLAVLWQLTAQLFRRKLPDFEKELNKSVADRQTNDILGEIAWHVAALASLYNLRLGEVAKQNMAKVAHRLDREHPTPLHDEGRVPSEQLPRRFDVTVVQVADGRSRMYLNGRQLGDDLTDNYYVDDGYRYHDIMHLANVAKLGWSPVLRGLMKRKRKSDPQLDDVEDGARAKIVEELVIKAIHSEGERLANLKGKNSADSPERYFPNADDISFRFLKSIRGFVRGLEVEKNRDWEWEEAILTGHEIFYQLRMEGQGTVTVDLDARSISFQPEAFPNINGMIAGLGSSTVGYNDPTLTCASTGDDEPVQALRVAAKSLAQKRAILDAIGIGDYNLVDCLSVVEMPRGCVSVKASGVVKDAFWDRQVVQFRFSCTPDENGVHCTAIAMTD